MIKLIMFEVIMCVQRVLTRLCVRPRAPARPIPCFFYLLYRALADRGLARSCAKGMDDVHEIIQAHT